MGMYRDQSGEFVFGYRGLKVKRCQYYTAEPRFTGIRLICTPRYYGQFSLALG